MLDSFEFQHKFPKKEKRNPVKFNVRLNSNVLFMKLRYLDTAQTVKVNKKENTASETHQQDVKRGMGLSTQPRLHPVTPGDGGPGHTFTRGDAIRDARCSDVGVSEGGSVFSA